MKYLKTYESVQQYKIGDYILVNDPKRQIYYDILRIADIDVYGGNHFYYECDIADDNGDYDKGLQIMIGDEHIIKKSSLEEVEMLKNVDKYNL